MTDARHRDKPQTGFYERRREQARSMIEMDGIGSKTELGICGMSCRYSYEINGAVKLLYLWDGADF